MSRIILLIVLMAGFLFAQGSVQSLSIIQPEFYTLTLDSTEETIVYYIYPPASGVNSALRTSISTTLPTYSATQARHREYNASGAFTISVVTDTSTAEESDSLYAYVQTLIYDPNKLTWYRSANDTLFLDFTTAGTYTGTSLKYLDWTHGRCYTANLGGDIMPGAGLAITFGAKQANTAGSETNLYLGFWWER